MYLDLGIGVPEPAKVSEDVVLIKDLPLDQKAAVVTVIKSYRQKPEFLKQAPAPNSIQVTRAAASAARSNTTSDPVAQ